MMSRGDQGAFYPTGAFTWPKMTDLRAPRLLVLVLAGLVFLAVILLQRLDSGAFQAASCLSSLPTPLHESSSPPPTPQPLSAAEKATPLPGPEAPLNADALPPGTCQQGPISYPRLVPVCMNMSQLVLPPPQQTNTPFNVTFHAKDAKGRPVGVGGSVYYALLEGPALVVGRVHEQADGDLRLEFTAPLGGVYKLYLTLLYDRLDHLLARWEDSCNLSVADMAKCLMSCHNSGIWAEPSGVLIDLYYESCMDVCREYYGAPKFRGDETVLGGIRVGGQQKLLAENAPVCGIDLAPDQAGFWVDTSAVCGPSRDLQCLRKVFLCPDHLYSRKGHLCSSRLMWRPLTCRHVLWRGGEQQLNDTRLPAARERYLQRMSNHLVMCGDSTTRELSDITKVHHPELNQTYNLDRDKCASFQGSILFMGGCGFHGADINARPMRAMLTACQQEVKRLNTTERKHIFFRTGPAVHPWKILSEEAKDAAWIPPFHGQRLWMTLQRVQVFNKGVQETLKAKGVAYHVLDEYAMTEPLRHWQLDSLHWWLGYRYYNITTFVVESVMNSFVASLAHIAAQES